MKGLSPSPWEGKDGRLCGLIEMSDQSGSRQVYNHVGNKTGAFRFNSESKHNFGSPRGTYGKELAIYIKWLEIDVVGRSFEGSLKVAARTKLLGRLNAESLNKPKAPI